MTRTELQWQLDAVCEEIRRYPTPIARCDEQLTALIEERTRLFSSLEQKLDPCNPCSAEAVWINDGGFDVA